MEPWQARDDGLMRDAAGDAPARRATVEVVHAVEQHPARWQLVTRESALSLPVPIGRAGDEALAFLWYPVGGPAQNRVVVSPTYLATASLRRPDDIVYRPVGATDLGLGVPPGTPLGKPTIGGPTTSAEMKELRGEYFTALDALLDVALAGTALAGTALAGEAQAAAARLHTLFYRLAIVSLRPAYRALHPAFFAWLDRAAPA